MSKKIKVGILFGGKSAEHEISIKSAMNVAQALDPEAYDIVLMGIDKEGKWHLDADSKKWLAPNASTEAIGSGADTQLQFVPGESNHQIQTISSQRELGSLDVVIPMLHGPYGEDGAVQGLLKLANIPFVGASVLGSAVGMDKDVMKRLLRDAGIKNARFRSFTTANRHQIDYASLERELGTPMFIKPANLGSSVGISKVATEAEFAAGVADAFRFDRKIIIEEQIVGRELECALLGNDEVEVSVAGEVGNVDEKHGFYSYSAKYLDEKGASIQIPADLTEEELKKVQEVSVATYRVLCCEGLARVDSFLTESGEVYVNEINTLPGFTDISMYPKLWEASGKGYKELLDQLIRLAMERNQAEGNLLTSLE
ncbi:MAG: D-alanine--D-alanine ligase [Bacteroidota bacterium]